MAEPSGLNADDLTILLRVVGSRKGADIDALLAFEQSHYRQSSTRQEVEQSVARLISAGLIMPQGDHYVGTPEVQAAFLNECRNCRDTVEEFDILNRIIAQFGKIEPGKSQTTSPRTDSSGRWREP